MKELRRLLDERAGQWEGDLLRAARDERPSRRARQRAMAVVALGAAGVPSATVSVAAAKAAATVNALLGAKWLAIGASVGAVAIGGVVASEGRWTSRPSARHEVSAATIDARPKLAPTGEAPPPVVATAPPSIAAPAVRPRAQEVATPNSDANRKPPRSSIPAGALGEEGPSWVQPAPLPAGTSDPALTEEVRLLDEARASMERSEPRKAMQTLDAYDARFPAGILSPEAVVLRIEALQKDGQREAAVLLARQYLIQHPKSPHATRIRALLAGAPNL